MRPRGAERRSGSFVMVLWVVLVWLILALGVEGATYGPPPQPAGGTVIVEMKDNDFAPAVLRVVPGSAVVWRNTGRNPHTVTADDASWDSGDILPGDEYQRTFDQVGTILYHCVPHGFRRGRGMAGMILVGEAVSPVDVARPAQVPAAGPGRTLRVPSQFRAIQDAVDSARPGDLILIAPGVYREEVVVTTPRLTLRGEDRNRVVLDGGFGAHNGIKVLGADGVVVENMTARHYTTNGFFWTGVRGYRGSYLTAYNNGDYGIYAFASVFGQFDHSYASGHPDAGFYIGQCKPCHALITDVIAENNALGYSGTNAGGNLTITRSAWRHNMAGIVPNTLDVEALAPQDGARIVGNLVYSNCNDRAPAGRLEYASFGNGIIVAGGINNIVEGNAVWDHANYGILIVPNIDRNLWIPSGNRVRGNTVWASARADLALAAPSGGGTCFADNRFTSSRPPAIQHAYGCGSPLSRVGGGDPGALAVMLLQYRSAATGTFSPGNWGTQPAPPKQPSMPDPSAPPAPAWPTPESLQRSAQDIPHIPSAPAIPPEAAAFAPAAAGPPPAVTEYLRLLGYLLPFLVYDAVVIAVTRDARRRRMRFLRRAGWVAAAIVLPYLGALLYAWRRPRRAQTAA